ncbi:MAG: hypothetical protein WD928_10245 [Gammaproteobacteria bacterium]
MHARLSALVGHASTLEALRPPSDIDFYRRYRAEGARWRTELEATFAREAAQNVGIYATTHRPGSVREGDPVYLAS